MSLVSIIIPMYNVEQFIDRSLNSVQSQTYPELEIICVNDGSTDSTTSIVKKHMVDDNRIILISTINHNAGYARNLGLSIARGDYLLFLDADDFFENDLVEKSISAIRVNSAQLCVFRSDSFDYNTGEFKDADWTINKKLLPSNCFSPQDVKKDIFKLFIGWPWDKLYSADFIRSAKITFQEQRTTNDMYFVFMSIILSEKICVIDDILAHHQRNYSSISNTRELSWTCFYDALIKVKEGLIEHKIYETYHLDFINYCLHSCLWNLESLLPPEQELLYDKLKNEWFNKLEIDNLCQNDCYNKSEYEKSRKIMQLDYKTYFES